MQVRDELAAARRRGGSQEAEPATPCALAGPELLQMRFLVSSALLWLPVEVPLRSEDSIGRRGPLKKANAQRRGGRAPTLIVIEPVEPVPPVPDELLASTRSKWENYWASEVAGAARDVDQLAIERLFFYYDDWERCRRAYTAKPLIPGSAGQAVENPLGKRMLALESAIARLEAEVGVTPLARQRLGIAIGQAAMTVDQLIDLARNGEGEDCDQIASEILEAEWPEAP